MSRVLHPALLELVVRSFRGRVIRFARLLKSPKYLIGLVIIFGYYGCILAGPLGRGGMPRTMRAGIPSDMLVGVHVAVALGLAFVLTLTWLLTRGRTALLLSEADLHALLPAPLSRRQVIRYALLKVQPGLLLGALLMTLFLGRGPLSDRVERFAGMWVLLTLWYLHAQAVELWKGSLRERPAPARWARRLAVVAAVLAFWAVVVVALREVPAHALDLVESARGGARAGSPAGALLTAPRAFFAGLGHVGTHGALGAALWPLYWATAPLFPAGASWHLALAWGWPLVLIVLHERLIVRTTAAFEEASLEQARQQAQARENPWEYLRKLALRKTSEADRLRAPFRLAPVGRPEVAVLWKNLIVVRRTPWPRALAVAVAAGVASLVLVAATGAPLALVSAILGLSGMVALALPLLSGNLTRNDLRLDALSLDVLRTWPVPGPRLVTAEVAAAVLGAMSYVTLFLVASAGALGGVGVALVLGRAGAPWARAGAALEASLGVGYVGLGVIVLVAGLPPCGGLTALSASLQNLGVATFPAWMRLGRGRASHGVAAIGPRALLGLGLTALMMLGLVPGGVLATFWMLLRSALGGGVAWWDLPIASVLLTVPLLVESAIVVRAAGLAWDRLDPSQELLEPSSS